MYLEYDVRWNKIVRLKVCRLLEKFMYVRSSYYYNVKRFRKRYFVTLLGKREACQRFRTMDPSCSKCLF